MATMNIETKAISDIACERFVYSNSDALANFLELYDDQKHAVKELAKLIKRFYEYDLHYVENVSLNIATEILRAVLKLVDFEAAAKYCIEEYLCFTRNSKQNKYTS